MQCIPHEHAHSNWGCIPQWGSVYDASAFRNLGSIEKVDGNALQGKNDIERFQCINSAEVTVEGNLPGWSTVPRGKKKQGNRNKVDELGSPAQGKEWVKLTPTVDSGAWETMLDLSLIHISEPTRPY